MEASSAQAGQSLNRSSRLRAWGDAAVGALARHDPGFGALRRGGRAAILMPAAFALGLEVLGNLNVAIFCAFGSMALLLFADFRGSLRDRVRAQAALAIAGAGLICLGTLASSSEALAAIAMALVGSLVLFSGVISSVLASASVPLLLVFIVPVALGGPSGTIPDRLAGWGIVSAVSLVAIVGMWPAPVQTPLLNAAIEALAALAQRLRLESAEAVAPDRSRAGAGEEDEDLSQAGGVDGVAAAHVAAVQARAAAAVAAIARVFSASPYRPAGLSTGSRALVLLVDDLRLLFEIAEEQDADRFVGEVGQELAHLRREAAGVLERAAALLADVRSDAAALHAALATMQQAAKALEEAATRRVPRLSASGDRDVEQHGLELVRACIEPAFRAREASFIVVQLAANVEAYAAAEQRGWIERLAGRRPSSSGSVPASSGRSPSSSGPLAVARVRARAHLDPRSVWLHNALRGGVALGVAVLLADLLKVEHSLWVVIGALTILRSNALSTGQNVVGAMLGTVVGFVVGCALIQLIGASSVVLWLLLPVAVLLAGVAPAALSFAAGQAAFTLVLLILFNLIAPEGWRIGITRVEDVAIGGGTCLLVGALLWPRGARAALTAALADAYAAAADYLLAAVSFATSRCDSGQPLCVAPRAEASMLLATMLRLDDAFRSFVAERGTKRLALPEATALVNGPAALRLAAAAILDLWAQAPPAAAKRAAATRELVTAVGTVDSWYRGFAAALEGAAPVPEPESLRPSAGEPLFETIAADLRADAVQAPGEPSASSEIAVRIFWTAEHLSAARRLERRVAGPARIALAQVGQPSAPARDVEPAAATA
jgi:uncharacterized membrane protein YccC